MFNIIYDPVLDLPVCTADKCGYAIDMRNIRKHMRKTHDMQLPNDKFKDLEHYLLASRKDTDHAEHLSVRAKYIRTTTADYTVGPVLPALETIPVYDCFKCPRCAKICKQYDAMRRHVGGPECSKRKEGDSGLAPIAVTAQSVFGGNKTKFFGVLTSTPHGDSCEITKLMQKMEGRKPSAVGQVDVSRMNSFAAIMRFDSHLAQNKVSYEQAFLLAAISNTERDKYARKLISLYRRRAFDTTERMVYIKSHSFMDSDLSLAVSANTVDLYDARTSRLLAFIFSCCMDHPHLRKHFPEATVKLVTLLAVPNRKADGEALSLLHGVLCSLFFDALSEEEDALILFISCSSVCRGLDKTSYRLGTANEVSPMMATLKHLAKCIAVTDLYIKHTPSTTRGWERITKATEGNMDTGVFYVQHCMKTCNRLRDGEMQNVRFMVCPRHPLCAIVDGFELSLGTLGNKMRELQRKAWTMLEANILNGLIITDEFWYACSELQDALSDRTPSYWFGTHNANRHVHNSWSHAFKNAIRPVVLDAQGGFQLKKTKDFVNRCEELQRLIYVLLQTCSGAPARATELGVIQICNTPTACRNIYISNGQLFLATFYHKSRNMQEGVGKPIVRYPDAVTAGIIMIYLIIVRPVEQALVQALDVAASNPAVKPSEAEISSTDHRDFLFVSRAKPVHGDRLRIWFQIETKSIGIPLQTNQYRQYHAGAVKNFLHGRTDAGEGKASTAFILHNQSGHTEQTAHDIYGISELDMRKLTGTEIDAFRHASQSWHEAIGMKHGKPCAFEEESSQSSPVSESGKSLKRSRLTSDADADILSEIRMEHTKDRQESNARFHNLEQMIQQFMSEFRSRESKYISVIEEQKQHINVLHCKRDPMQADLDSPLPPAKKHRAVNSNEQNWTTEMRRFLDNNRASFRSKEQEIAINLAIQADKDALIVLPTGGGKSMTFMMPAFVRPEKITVVVVPLVALQQDLSRRCAEAGIQASLWSDREIAGSRIIIASVEHVEKQDYQAFIRTLFLTDKLHAIFIDEAHLVVLWSTFRFAMQTLHEQIRPSGVNVPIIALTATSPPSLTQHIAIACGMRDWSVIRQMTSRPNIRYSVRDVTEADLYRCVDATLCSLLKEYNTSNCRAIVYVPTRDACDVLATMLSAISPGTPCFTYHAGLSNSERRTMQGFWAHTGDGKAHVMVATSAFGCGIDIPTVRVVIHAGLPSSLMEYIQESGRAGRDGNPASSIVFNLYNNRWKTRAPEDRVPFQPDGSDPASEKIDSFGNVEELREDIKTCRRWLLDRFADGTSPSKSCSERDMEPCDVCHPKLYKPITVRDASETQRLASTPKSSSTKTCSTSASVDEIKEFFAHFGTNGCPVCTVLQRKMVHHEGSTDEARWVCYRSRCLRCGMKGHTSSECKRFQRSQNTGGGGCYACTFRKLDGVDIHGEGEYGRSQCRMKKTLCLCLLCSENMTLRKEMCQDLPGFAVLQTPAQIEDWLVGRQPHTEKGVKFFLPWFKDKLL